MTHSRWCLVPALVASACVSPLHLDETTAPPLTLEISDEFAQVVAEIDRLRVRISRPPGIARDTALATGGHEGVLRVRAVLRPEEGQPGTVVDLSAVSGVTPLFRGSLVVGEGDGWPLEIRVPMIPVATFEAGDDRVITVGQNIDLDALPVATFVTGTTMTPQDVAWISEDSTVVRIDGMTAVGAGVGLTRVFGVWFGELDSMTVEVTGSAMNQGR